MSTLLNSFSFALFLKKADVRVNYLKRPYSVSMGTFQMAILLCFNNSVTLSVKDLQENTQLPEKELVKQVQSLLESKLLIIPNGDGEGASSSEMKVSSPESF